MKTLLTLSRWIHIL